MGTKISISEFAKGYLCAVCSLIKKNGGVDTTTRELFRELGIPFNLDLWVNSCVDKDDIETLIQYANELK